MAGTTATAVRRSTGGAIAVALLTGVGCAHQQEGFRLLNEGAPPRELRHLRLTAATSQTLTLVAVVRLDHHHRGKNPEHVSIQTPPVKYTMTITLSELSDSITRFRCKIDSAEVAPDSHWPAEKLDEFRRLIGAHVGQEKQGIAGPTIVSPVWSQGLGRAELVDPLITVGMYWMVPSGFPKVPIGIGASWTFLNHEIRPDSVVDTETIDDLVGWENDTATIRTTVRRTFASGNSGRDFTRARTDLESKVDTHKLAALSVFGKRLFEEETSDDFLRVETDFEYSTKQ